MRRAAIVLLLLVLPALTGCLRMDAYRLQHDPRGSLESLLQQHEYEKARELINTRALPDTMAKQAEISELITAYERHTLAAAREMQSRDPDHLLSVIQLIDEALGKIPRSDSLHEYRMSLETRRIEQLRLNGRKRMLARARYLREEQVLYEELEGLQSPNLKQRVSNAVYRKEIPALTEKLIDCGQQARQDNELQVAHECLQLAREFSSSPQVQQEMAQLQTAHASRQQAAKPEGKRTVHTVKTPSARLPVRTVQLSANEQSGQQDSESLIALADAALRSNDLVTARDTFIKIPTASRASHQATELGKRLHSAIQSRINTLLARGDRQYRRDDVMDAIDSWAAAEVLDPDNQTVQERLGRARKVMARLEELKGLQGK